MFRQIKGQDHVVDLLSTQIANDRVAQAYLFHGQDGVGKLMTALYFGMGLNCLSSNHFKPCGVCNSCTKFLAFEHPDFVFIFPSSNLQMTIEGEIKNNDAKKQYEDYVQNKISTPWLDVLGSGFQDIRKESILMLNRRLDFSISEAKYRIVIIESADMMNQVTANAFLKRLEEPPANTVIILITERLSMVLPTIVSRCQQVYFKPLSSSIIANCLMDKFNVSAAGALTAAKMAGGNYKEAARIALQSNDTIRLLAFQILRQASNKDDLGFYNQLSKQKEKLNSEEAKELLKIVSIIADDVLMSFHCPEAVINIDYKDFIHDLSAGRMGIQERALPFLLLTQELSRRISGNVNLNLILIKLYFGLKDFIGE